MKSVMITTALAAITATIISGCTPTQDTEGAVFEVTDNMVTIRGAYDMTLGSGVAKPTQAMIAQAEAVCPGAVYMTAVPSNLHQYDATFLYKFRCPTGPKRG